MSSPCEPEAHDFTLERYAEFYARLKSNSVMVGIYDKDGNLLDQRIGMAVTKTEIKP